MASLAADIPETAEPKPLSPAWRSALIRLGIAWMAILAAFARDALDMVAIWWDSSTFNHILLIPFILGWLVMQRTQELRRITPRSGGPVCWSWRQRAVAGCWARRRASRWRGIWRS